MGGVADELDRKGVKVGVFKSFPAKARFDLRNLSFFILVNSWCAWESTN